MNEQLITKFPKLFRQALEEKRIKLPDDVKDTYEPIKAYRVLFLSKGETPEITKETFYSQIELNFYGKRASNKLDFNNVEYYSCSLFEDIKTIATIMKLPKWNRILICGMVKSENGIMNYNEKTSHINWWLYENHTAVEDFEVIEYVKK